MSVTVLNVSLESNQYFQNSLTLHTSTAQTVIFGILDSGSNESIFKNSKFFICHILLIFLFLNPVKKNYRLNNLIDEIQKSKNNRKRIFSRVNNEHSFNKVDDSCLSNRFLK